MYKVSGPNYRDNILDYFKIKDPVVFSILKSKKSDWNYPFKSAYRLHHDTSEKIDIAAFLSAVITFSKNRDPIREKSSLNMPERGDRFLNKIIEEKTLSDKISGFIMSTYIAEKLLNKLTYDSNFAWFMKATTEIRNETYDAEYIIVDTANLFYKIKEYDGTNPSLKYIRDRIICDSSIFNCVKELAEYFSNELNGNLYKFIFVNPSSKKDFDDDYFILPIDCKEYIGQKCSAETYTNEVDDCFLLMLYDYCQKTFDRKVSILSGDNYDFSLISQDYARPIRRALISNDKQPVILSWDDIIFENHEFNFNKLTIFEEDFSV